MTVPTDTERPRYEAVLKPLEWEQRMRVDYRDDVLRIVAVLAGDGIAISEDVAFMAWQRFSEEERCAGWYGLGTDDEIRRNLMPHLELQSFAEQEPWLALVTSQQTGSHHPMNDVEHRHTRTALALMRMAMALLDRAGCTLAAAHLQHAIDTVEACHGKSAMPPRSAASTGAGFGHHDDQRVAGIGEGTGS